MLEPDTQVATMDRYIIATEAILATEIADIIVTGGCRGYGVNSSTVLKTCVLQGSVFLTNWKCDSKDVKLKPRALGAFAFGRLWWRSPCCQKRECHACCWALSGRRSKLQYQGAVLGRDAG